MSIVAMADEPDEGEKAEIVEWDESLDALAAIVRQEAAAIEELGATWLDHACRAGRALMAARETVPSGQWERFVAEKCGVSRSTASYWIRAASDEANMRALGVTSSDEVKGLVAPSPFPAGPRLLLSEESIARARRLRDKGVSYREIAAEVGVGFGAVREALDPQARARNRLKLAAASRKRREREKAAREAEQALAREKQRAERDALAKSASGDLEKAYSHVRVALQAADRYRGTLPPDDAARQAMHLAICHLNKAEGQLVGAMRVKSVEPSVAKQVASETLNGKDNGHDNHIRP